MLVTGSSGTVGSVLARALASEYDLLGLDRRAGPLTDFVTDLTDLSSALPAFEGADAVVDLAATPDVMAPWQDVWANNVTATMNALEAARRAGVTRYVFGSSHHIVGMYERDAPYASIISGDYGAIEHGQFRLINADVPIRPDSFYAIGKALGEAAARFYADEYGLSAISLRIGTVHPTDRPQNLRHFATLLTHQDLVQLVRRCIDAPPDLPYSTFYGVSANRWRIWDIENARHAIGYTPVDDSERWRDR